MGADRIPEWVADTLRYERMTFQETARCPECLTLGQMRPQYGNYVCDKCDRSWPPDHLTFFLKAFEKGREYERMEANPQIGPGPGPHDHWPPAGSGPPPKPDNRGEGIGGGLM